MIRRLAMAWAALGALAVAGPADGQALYDRGTTIPDQNALNRIGLERTWFGAVPLRTGVEQMIQLSLSADGELIFAQTTEAALHCFEAETGRLVWTTDLGGPSGQAQDVGVMAERPTLLLVPSAESVDDLPAEGRYQVVVAQIRDILYFRIFNADGTTALDANEAEFPGNSRRIEALKQALADLWVAESIPPAQSRQIIADVTSLVGVTPATQVFATNGNFLYSLDRATGRQVWVERMEVNASSPVAASLDLVMAGLVNGKLVAYSLRPSEDPRFRRQVGAPGGFAWNFATRGPVTAEPIPTQFVTAFASQGGNLYVSLLDPPQMLHRSQPLGPLVASMGTFGTGPESRLLVPSMDRNLYAINLFTGEQEWIFPTGAPIDAQPLVGGGDVTVARRVTEPRTRTVVGTDLREYEQEYTEVVDQPLTLTMPPTVYVLNSEGDLFAIDPDSGTSRWTQPILIPGTEEEVTDPRTGRRVVRPGTNLPMIDPATGQPAQQPRRVRTGAEQLLALTPTRIYLRTEYGDLAVVERASGELIAGPSATFQRFGIDLRGYTLATTNDVHDRIYLASSSGSIVCLRESQLARSGIVGPVPLRSEDARPFGYLRDPSAPVSQSPPPVPIPQGGGVDEAPADDDNPFDFGFGSRPVRAASEQ